MKRIKPWLESQGSCFWLPCAVIFVFTAFSIIGYETRMYLTGERVGLVNVFVGLCFSCLTWYATKRAFQEFEALERGSSIEHEEQQ